MATRLNTALFTIVKGITMSTRTSSRLNTRDFINIGVFTALMFVIVFAFGMLGFFGPAAMFPGFLISILINGIVFALFTARTPKMWALTIMLIIIEILFSVTGHWVGGIAIAIVFGLLADLVVTKGPKSMKVRVPLAYALFILPIYVSPWMPLFMNQDAYMSAIAEQMGAEYAAKMAQVVTIPILLGFFVVMLIVGWIAGLMGTRIARKHFERAGLV